MQHIMADGHERGFSGQRLADLMEEPGLRMAPRPIISRRRGYRSDFGSFGGGIDVAIGEHGAGQGVDGAGDVIMHAAAVAFVDGAAVHGEQIDLMTLEDRESSANTPGSSKPMRVLTVNGICTASRSAHRMESTRSSSRRRPPPAHFL